MARTEAHREIDTTAEFEPIFLNRELSWLDFNARVLALAEDPTGPLLERAKFLAIFSSNLDEFFQVRVAGLKEQLAAGVRTTRPTGSTSASSSTRSASGSHELVARQAALFTEEIVPRARGSGRRIVDWDDARRRRPRVARRGVRRPHLPGAHAARRRPRPPVPVHLEPVAEPRGRRCATPTTRRAALRAREGAAAAAALRRVPGGRRFVPLEQVIAAHLDALFPGMEILAHYAVPRHARRRLRARATRPRTSSRRWSRAPAAPPLGRARAARGRHRRCRPELLELLCRELELEERRRVHRVDGPLDLGGSAASYGPATARAEVPSRGSAARSRRLAAPDGRRRTSSRCCARGDVLVHHPYDSFATSVEEFVEPGRRRSERARDQADAVPHRRRRSPIVQSLVAGRRGRQAGRRARRAEGALRRAGQHRVGPRAGGGRRARRVRPRRAEDPRQDRCSSCARRRDGIRRYCHVGTGNYNPETARVYEDLGLLTADPELGADLTELFNLPHRLQPPARLPAGCWSRPPRCATASRR